jgi:hypothetical protein
VSASAQLALAFSSGPGTGQILSASQTLALRAALQRRKLALCFGGGVDSTALLVALKAAGIRPHVITFADTGGEKPQTYEHVRRMQSVLESWGFPRIETVRHRTNPDTPYASLEGNCLENETLPSLAFGMKSCSIKWKQGPQDQFLKGAKSGPNAQPAHPLWTEAQGAGERIVKLIGYDAGRADKRRSKNLKASDADFDYLYPLQILGWTRVDCVRAIVNKLGPRYLPIKSACFYCPASKPWELYWLAAHEPELFERALAIERRALTGRHSRFDELYFGDTWESLVRNAESFPSSNTSVGLGRKFAWNQWARVNGIVDEQFKVRRHLLSRFAEIADQMRGEDNALDMRSCA